MDSKKSITHLTAGLILGGFMIIYGLGLHFTGMSQRRSLQWISFAIMIGGLIFFINRHGAVNNNTVSFGGLFGYGFKATSIVILLVVIYTVLFFTIFPEVRDEMFDVARRQMEEQNKLSDDEIDKAIVMVKKFFWVFTIGGILLSYAIIGAIGSLIGAAVTKRKPYNPLDQLNMR
jgi:NADH:ubiquinone oxidoreductase subunit 6 (subunit J)